ncbi:MAG TPA: GAF domain-containing protein [Candidatus Baltobacteraceae bacterium]|nr:GAF domain-containing protein [Candidatus Baltobacteraceae bacterium]
MLCALTTLMAGVVILSAYWGPGGRPSLGYWDSIVTTTAEPFVVQFVQSTAGGATARAGIRDGDRVDLRTLDARGRVSVLFQPYAGLPLSFAVERGTKRVAIRFTPSTQFDGNAAFKMTNVALLVLAYLWALGCAWLIALRRGASREGWYLCLALLALDAQSVAPATFPLPDGTAGAFTYLAWGCTTCAAAVLPVVLGRRFGARSRRRVVAEAATAALAAAMFAGFAAGALGLLNASIDPLPFVFGAFGRIVKVALDAAAVVAVALAVAGTARADRARAAWLLLPLPAAFLLATVAHRLEVFASSWESYMVLELAANAMLLAGAAAVTYALLKRRVLDVQFVIGRTLVVAGVSAVVVASFVLLEWLLGTVLANVSHATGLVANAALALGLGLSMSYIHKRVDLFVDFAFFHRRRENERALRDFAREAAFVTRRDDLLDHAIDKIRAHTDARSAAVLLDGDGVYRVVRSFGDLPVEAGENDPAILALKARHAPLDPHRYPTALHADVALPMLARGRLLGVLLCGARAGGEAYAPDEVAALSDLAHGVGGALDALDRTDGAQARDDAILAELRALRGDVAALRPQP